MTLADELRAHRAQVVADVWEKAQNAWATFVESTKQTAAAGGRCVILSPESGSPMSRATCAALAARAEAEGGMKSTRHAFKGRVWWECRW